MTRALIVHPGTQHSIRMATEFQRLGVLSGFHTGFAAGRGSAWQSIAEHIPHSLRRRISNRLAYSVPANLIHNHIGIELAWQVCQAMNRASESTILWRNAWFQERLSAHALDGADIVIGFDTSSWIISKRCADMGKPMIMVQTIGHPAAATEVDEALERDFPAWHAAGYMRNLALRAAEETEFKYSSAVVCSSSFTRQTMVANGVLADKIHVISHGVDLASFSPALGAVDNGRPFRFIFVGALSARKGAPILLEAWRRLATNNAELWLVGPMSKRAFDLIPSLPGLRIVGQVPGGEVPNLLRQCDVFVFPSYFEGFGLVILQAMACGLPVITTPSTAGPDLIRKPGDGGWIVPTGEVEALISAMDHCLTHRYEMPQIGLIARQIAEEHSWMAYGDSWSLLFEQMKPRASALNSAPKNNSLHAIALQNVLLAHPGTQYSFHLAAELERCGRLAEFHTGFGVPNRLMAGNTDLFPEFLRRRLRNRLLDQVPWSKTKLYPFSHLSSYLKSAGQKRSEEAVLHDRNEGFQLAIPGRALRRTNTVIGFDTSSWILASRVKSFGRRFILDQSIGHSLAKERIYADLRRRFPAWSFSISQKPDFQLREEALEHDLADIIAVPSEFVKTTLVAEGVLASKIRVIPFGTDLSLFYPGQRTRKNGPMAFLFVGSISARKGIPVLLEAWRRLGLSNAELWLVGGGQVPTEEMLSANVRLLGRKAQSELAGLMRAADVFVFPSFFEGLAQVQIEAMASGLPVIGTFESGATEIVTDGQNGFVVPAGEIDALADKMHQLATKPELLAAMRANASFHRERLGWSVYGDRWCQLLSQES